MPIVYKTGNLLDGPETFIAHGCNAKGVMGSGIAREIRERRPDAYTAYRERFIANGDHLSLGEVIVAAKAGEQTIFNCITQERYGNEPGIVYVSYDGVRAALKTIDVYAIAHQAATGERLVVGFPLIGAGLAAGSWKRIAAIIEQEARNFDPVVYLFDGVMPTT